MAVVAGLADLRIKVKIGEWPNEVPDPIRFGEDRTHAAYDPEYARRFWRILLQVDRAFRLLVQPREAACEVLQPIIEKVWRTCEGAEIRGRTVTLKVKYADFQQITRSRAGPALFSTRAEIEQLIISYALLEPLFPVTKGIRLLGMTLSSLGEKQLESGPQLRLSF